MTKIKVWEWMMLDPSTNELFVEWSDEPFIVDPLSESEIEWLNEWHKVIEK